MTPILKKYKAAAVNAEPGWFDLEESVRRTIHWIDEAGKAGCKFIAFPELWIPGYPYWAWKVNYQESLPLLKKYRENSLPSDSEEMRRIRNAARANKIYVSLGYSEVDLASLYTTQVLISPTGDILNHRRKIRATHVERLVFGDGTGDTTESVTQTEIGRVGHLNCWENMNPFMKAYAASLGEQVHVAAWPLYPGKETLKYPDPFTNVAEANADLVTPAYAIETGTFTLAPWQTITADGIKLNTPPGKELEDPHIYNGHGRIFGPDGQNLVAHPDKDFQGLLFVDIDLDECHLSKALADFGGHYMRPDLIRLLVDTNRKDLVVHEDRVNGGVAYTRTVDRVGLSAPLEASRITDPMRRKRGGARVPRTKRKSSSRPSSSSTIRTVGGKDEILQESTPIAEGPWNSNNEDDLLDHFMSLGKPGAGLRSIESSVAEMEHIFDHIFGIENGNHLVSESDESVPDLLQVYGSDEDILDAYYVFIHLYYPILPPPERLPAYNRPLNENLPFRPSSPLSLAISAILVLIPHPGIKQPATPEDTRLRRNVAHSFAQSALEAVEADLELLDSSSDPSRALSDGAPMIARQPFHPKVPLSLEAILALVLLSVYEYAQRGNIRKMCNRAGQALAAAMNMSLHEMVEDDEYAEARRRAWWITYLTVCQGSIASGMPAAFNLYDPRFVTPYPEGWKLLIEAQQTILEATTFVHDLDQTVKSRFKASWISSRMTELDDQITTLLLLCRRSSLSTTVSPLDSPEKIVSQTINQIAEIKLHSARIKVHRFCAFSDVPIFRKRHCDLQPECCGAASAESAIPSPPEDIPLPSIMKSDHPDLTFPFSSHTSSKICLQSALNIVTLVDNLPYPNPDHTIPLTLPPYLSNASRVEIPRVMPTFACCVMQASYAMLMLYLKARAKHANSPEDSVSAKGLSLTGFLNELQQNLRLVSKILANYAIAAEALQGMKEEVSHWAFLDG
ncbi:hypothetical protein CNMCM8927_005438 [Aspergillus lentulus]|uniref:Cyanide hydratase n=1 Tax=Aspergillus lentulus TaxID=293939 RepID=A0AAN5YRJ0_ASPLE|nr:hypothetical protein CNMCM6069_004688 [Aspergillus lentulus]KAF4178135.1 hypothetical protein CNMCM8060_004718 [Aspergillus lentulus]KAF4183563.1 hypothetical protein CNMCM7927_009040 [Aspergillus lentulus]KAF4206032.1 hypothetical protein CNMCM8927_005438 [Aspergillus lentulus]